MKSLAVLCLGFFVSTSAFADSLACTLKVNGDYIVEHQAPDLREVKAKFKGFACDAYIKNNMMTVYLYEPALFMDNVQKATGPANMSLNLSLNNGDVQCLCGLM